MIATRFLFVAMLLTAATVHSSPPASLRELRNISPPDAVYQEELSHQKNEADLRLKEKFSTTKGARPAIKSVHVVFTTALDFERTIAYLQRRGVTLTLSRREDLRRALQGKRGRGNLVSTLRDNSFQMAHGLFQGWQVIVASNARKSRQELTQQTTITFIAKSRMVQPPS